MSPGDAGCSTKITRIDITLIMGSRNDAVLSKLEATTQDGVLQFRPHFSKDQRRSPAESSMP